MTIVKPTQAAQAFVRAVAVANHAFALRCPAITPEAAIETGEGWGRGLMRLLKEPGALLDGESALQEVAEFMPEGKAAVERWRQGRML